MVKIKRRFTKTKRRSDLMKRRFGKMKRRLDLIKLNY